MRKTIYAILALVLALAVLLPSPAMAAKPQPCTAGGVITYISPGTVFEAGNSGRWVVAERQVLGVLSGDIAGNFIMTYRANVELASQAGNLHGTLEVGQYTFEVNGEAQPLEIVWFAPFYTYLPKIAINGHWTLVNGAKGQGTFDAWCIFIPTPDGHVGAIIASDFSLNGQWQP